MSGSSRITNRHLERSTAVYVRQSTQNQVLKNRESCQRQCGLADRARELGWPGERILVIDSDLGQSAALQGTRSGFERLCEHVSQGRPAGSERYSKSTSVASLEIVPAGMISISAGASSPFSSVDATPQSRSGVTDARARGNARGHSCRSVCRGPIMGA
ncbi:MAG: hypothetical protein OXL68_14890 [Paracoccaceae bacterium]|nr:hypothetical protein [Paracoccaceae bacterium]